MFQTASLALSKHDNGLKVKEYLTLYRCFIPERFSSMMKKTASFLCLMLMAAAVQAAPSDSERIAALERQVAELTAQVNRLLSERLDERSARRNNEVHVCTLSAFTDTFRTENVNRGRARLDVIQQCRRQHAEMFCKEEAVRCQTYR